LDDTRPQNDTDEAKGDNASNRFDEALHTSDSGANDHTNAPLPTVDAFVPD